MNEQAKEPSVKGVILRWRGYGDGKPVLMPAEEMDAVALSESLGMDEARDHIRGLVARSRHWRMKIRRLYDRVPGLMSAIILLSAAARFTFSQSPARLRKCKTADWR